MYYLSTQTRTPSPHPDKIATEPLRLDPPGSAIQIDLRSKQIQIDGVRVREHVREIYGRICVALDVATQRRRVWPPPSVQSTLRRVTTLTRAPRSPCSSRFPRPKSRRALAAAARSLVRACASQPRTTVRSLCRGRDPLKPKTRNHAKGAAAGVTSGLRRPYGRPAGLRTGSRNRNRGHGGHPRLPRDVRGRRRKGSYGRTTSTRHQAEAGPSSGGRKGTGRRVFRERHADVAGGGPWSEEAAAEARGVHVAERRHALQPKQAEAAGGGDHRRAGDEVRATAADVGVRSAAPALAATPAACPAVLRHADDAPRAGRDADGGSRTRWHRADAHDTQRHGTDAPHARDQPVLFPEPAARLHRPGRVRRDRCVPGQFSMEES